MYSYCYVMYAYLYVYVFFLLLLCSILGILFHCVLCIFLCRYILYYCHRVSTQLQLSNISYHTISHHIISIITAFRRSTRPLSSELNRLGLKIKELLSCEYFFAYSYLPFDTTWYTRRSNLQEKSFIPNVIDFYTLLMIAYFTISNRNITFAL